MDRQARRPFLQTAALGVVSVVAGCFGDSEDGSGPSEPGTTGPNTEPASPAERLGVTASMLQQRSDTRPPKVQFRLENRSETPTDVQFGTTLFQQDEDLPWSRAIELDDDGYHGYGGPETPRDGCWRPVSRETPTSDLQRRTIDAGSALEKEFWVLTAPGESTCYPAGTHRFATALNAGDFVVELALTVSDGGRVSAEGRGPRSPP